MAALKRLFFKIFLVFVFLGVVFYFTVPEKHFKQASKTTVNDLSVELEVNPKVANFLVNTKLGRKVTYVFLKRKIKNLDYSEMYDASEKSSVER